MYVFFRHLIWTGFGLEDIVWQHVLTSLSHCNSLEVAV